MLTSSKIAATLALALLTGVAGCGSTDTKQDEADARMAERAKQAQEAIAERDKIQAETEEQAKVALKPIASAAAQQWPGLDARLMRCQRGGNLLSVEVKLVNTGQTPVEIDNYSISDATIVDEETKEETGVFERPGHPAGTTNLKTTLQPGQETILFAVFATSPTTTKLTIKIPGLAPFVGVSPTANAVQVTEATQQQRERVKEAQKNTKK